MATWTRQRIVSELAKHDEAASKRLDSYFDLDSSIRQRMRFDINDPTSDYLANAIGQLMSTAASPNGVVYWDDIRKKIGTAMVGEPAAKPAVAKPTKPWTRKKIITELAKTHPKAADKLDEYFDLDDDDKDEMSFDLDDVNDDDTLEEAIAHLFCRDESPDGGDYWEQVCEQLANDEREDMPWNRERLVERLSKTHPMAAAKLDKYFDLGDEEKKYMKFDPKDIPVDDSLADALGGHLMNITLSPDGSNYWEKVEEQLNDDEEEDDYDDVWTRERFKKELSSTHPTAAEKLDAYFDLSLAKRKKMEFNISESENDDEIADALHHLFEFDESPDGEHFWNKVYEQLENGHDEGDEWTKEKILDEMRKSHPIAAGKLEGFFNLSDSKKESMNFDMPCLDDSDELSEVIEKLFDHSETPEGTDYWERVIRQLSNGDDEREATWTRETLVAELKKTHSRAAAKLDKYFEDGELDMTLGEIDDDASLADALSDAFDWSDSPDEYSYWDKVTDQLVAGRGENDGWTREKIIKELKKTHPKAAKKLDAYFDLDDDDKSEMSFDMDDVDDDDESVQDAIGNLFCSRSSPDGEDYWDTVLQQLEDEEKETDEEKPRKWTRENIIAVLAKTHPKAAKKLDAYFDLSASDKEDMMFRLNKVKDSDEMHDVIDSLFQWSSSADGYDYWSDVVHMLRDGRSESGVGAPKVGAWSREKMVSAVGKTHPIAARKLDAYFDLDESVRRKMSFNLDDVRDDDEIGRAVCRLFQLSASPDGYSYWSNIVDQIKDGETEGEVMERGDWTPDKMVSELRKIDEKAADKLKGYFSLSDSKKAAMRFDFGDVEEYDTLSTALCHLFSLEDSGEDKFWLAIVDKIRDIEDGDDDDGTSGEDEEEDCEDESDDCDEDELADDDESGSNTEPTDFSSESFDRKEVLHAIEEFLAYGEKEMGKSHQGYFAGDGFAAKCLRSHLAELSKKKK
jgi:hypothetical protein